MPPFYAVLLLLNVNWCLAQLTEDKNLLLNWCLNSTFHKEKPGKEDILHSQCSPWKEKACCTKETTRSIHEVDIHNFTLNHCSEKKDLSENCRKFFNRDNCFYECEPHIGFWVVKTNRKIASERFLKVPLCASDCESWWEACKEDYTCVFNWPRNFKFIKGVNYCPLNSTCQTFQKVYSNATTFCENVWDHSWQYTPDNEPCMKMWFDGSKGNPNRKTAEYYIDKAFGRAASSSTANFILLLAFVISVSSWPTLNTL